MNRPAIEFLFDWLERNGIARAVLALGQANEDLATTYPAGRRGTLEIVPVIERERLESGGAIRHAVHSAAIVGPFVVLNGDVFVDFDLAPAIEAHRSFGADLTLALHAEQDPSAFGVAVLDDEDLVTGFVEKPLPGEAPSNLVNAGVWLFEPGLVDEIPPGAVRVEETLFPSLVARGRRVLGYRFEGPWADLGTPARYLALNDLLLQERNALAAGCNIAEHASVTGCSCARGVSVAQNAQVSHSILWEDARVEEGAVVEHSVLADGVVVGAGAKVIEAVVGSGAVIAPGCEVPRGTSIEPDARYDGTHG